MEGIFNIVIIFGVVVFCARFSSSADSFLVTRTPRASLTTAQVRGTGLPKPTSWHRRRNLEPIAKFSSTPYDLFRAAGAQRRSFYHIFDWDYWCQAQPRTGDCTRQSLRNQGQMTQKYFYDAQTNECKTFFYSGCDGNKNNFHTKLQCERHCKSSNYMELMDTSSSTYCYLQPSVGICLGLMQRYYYDEKSNDCKAFIYGGCGGNQNRFDSYDLCISRCKEDY